MNFFVTSHALGTPSSCHKLSHLLGPSPPSSVTYFMDGPKAKMPNGLSCWTKWIVGYFNQLQLESVAFIMPAPIIKSLGIVNVLGRVLTTSMGVVHSWTYMYIRTLACKMRP